MQIYHGTISTGVENIIKNGIVLEKGKLKVDFGQGFYTTSSYTFAQSTAINKARKTNTYNPNAHVEPYVLVYEFNYTKAKSNCNILSFSKMDTTWAQFIINNRNGFDYMNAVGSHFHNKTHKYDIVNGFIADNDIVLLASTLKALNKRVQKSDIDSMIYNYFTNQISFHTKESLAYIKLIRCDMIKRKGDVING